jgi:hypothetical protein
LVIYYICIYNIYAPILQSWRKTSQCCQTNNKRIRCDFLDNISSILFCWHIPNNIMYIIRKVTSNSLIICLTVLTSFHSWLQDGSIDIIYSIFNTLDISADIHCPNNDFLAQWCYHMMWQIQYTRKLILVCLTSSILERLRHAVLYTVILSRTTYSRILLSYVTTITIRCFIAFLWADILSKFSIHIIYSILSLWMRGWTSQASEMEPPVAAFFWSWSRSRKAN